MNLRVATESLLSEASSSGPLGRISIEGTSRDACSAGQSRISPAETASAVAGERQAEGRLVFSLAGAVAEPDRDLHLASTTNWIRLMQIAWDEGAIGALRDHLQHLPRGHVPPEVARHLARLALERRARMLILEQRARESIAVLGAAGIDVALLKGAALVATVHQSFASRPMKDVDVMVRPEDAEVAQQLMLRAGWTHDPDLPDDGVYRTHHHLPPLMDARGSRSHLEIHRNLLPPGHPFAFSGSDLWRAMRPAKFAGHPVLVLDPNLHAVHIAIHFAWSHYMRAGGWHAFRDLGTLTRAGIVEWDAVVRLAMSMRAATCCYWTLRLARTLSGLPVPDDVLAALAPAVNRRLLLRLERHFVNVLLRRDATHLSQRLDRALWSMAIQPRLQGHADARPWLVSPELTVARERHDTASRRDRALQHADRLARCSIYVASLLWWN